MPTNHNRRFLTKISDLDPRPNLTADWLAEIPPFLIAAVQYIKFIKPLETPKPILDMVFNTFAQQVFMNQISKTNLGKISHNQQIYQLNKIKMHQVKTT